MFETRKMKLIAGATAVGMLGFTARDADAAMMIELASNGDTLTATDEVFGEDEAFGTPGLLQVSGTVGDFVINSDIGLDSTFLAFPRALHLNTVAGTTGPGTLTVSLTVTDLSGPIGDFSSLFFAGGVSSGVVSIASFIDVDNDPFGEGTPVSSMTMSNPGSFKAEATPIVEIDAQYSATIVATIEHDGLGTSSFDAEVGVTPEPSSLALLGLGGLLIARRRRG